MEVGACGVFTVDYCVLAIVFILCFERFLLIGSMY